jgi:NADH-quinone oxidoreductase subunit C
LFGISFSKHPDLRRILTDYGFIGHPLQKNYPLGGLVQLGFSEIQKATVAEAIKILPGFRYNIVKSQPNPLL